MLVGESRSVGSFYVGGSGKSVTEGLSFLPSPSGLVDVHQVERKWSGKGCETAWASDSCRQWFVVGGVW